MKYFAIIGLFILVTACKTNKGIIGTPLPEDLSKDTAIQGFQDHVIDFTTFEGKAKMRFEDNDRRVSFRATIRIEKDERIWVSATMLGFEGARALITPDSVKVLNRLERKYYAESIDYLSELTNLPVDFEGMQNALIGNWLFFDEEVAKYEEKQGIVELVSEKEDIVNILWLDKASLLMERQTVLDQMNNRNMEVSYHDYREMKKSAFPYESNIHVSGSDEAWIDVDYSSIELDEDLSFPFTVNKSYEKVD